MIEAAEEKIYKRNRIVAFVDVLGASQAACDGKIDELVGKIFRLGRAMDWKHNRHLKNKEGEIEEVIKSRPGIAQFSDCLLLWSNPLDNLPPEDFASTAGSFLWNLCTEMGRLILADVPFRAGVSEGPVFILPELNIYAGRPIVEAVNLEEQQDWLGAAMLFSEEADRLIHRPDQIFFKGEESMFKHFISNENAPLKKEIKGTVCALNWALGVEENNSNLSYDFFREKIIELKAMSNPKVHPKYDNAINFLASIEKEKKS